MHALSISTVHYTLLQINGCELKWQHLVDLYEDGKGACREAPGLNMLHKLTREHVYLNSYSKMKVSLAVQVRNSLQYACEVVSLYTHALY